MVENFEPLVDVERAYLRNSRVPEHNALNMRARVAALRMTHQRIGELIDEHGLEAFLAAQEGIIDYVERVVRSRLREIPDGEWYSMGYHDHDGNENRMYPICVRVIKRGDRLVVDLTGTSPQAPGSINCARPCMEGAILGVILTFLCYDIPWAIAALRNIVEIVSEPGTLNNALSPAGVSMGSTMAPLSTQDVAAQAFAKMMLCSERYRERGAGQLDAGRQRLAADRAEPGRRAVRRRDHRLLQRRRRRAHVRRRDRQRRHLPLDGVADGERRDRREPRAGAPGLPPRAGRRRRPGPLPRRRRRRVRDRAAQDADPPRRTQQRRLGRQRARRARRSRAPRPGAAGAQRDPARLEPRRAVRRGPRAALGRRGRARARST